MSRDTKLTPAVTARVFAGLRAHGNARKACRDAGIHHDSHYAWMRDGLRAPDGPAGAYRAGALAALAEREVRLEAMVEAAASGTADEPGDWRAAAFLLDLREKRAQNALTAAKLRAETKLARAKAAGLIPDVTVTVTDPAQVDALFREHFGHAGARSLPAGTHDPGADAGLRDVGATPLPVPAPLDR